MKTRIGWILAIMIISLLSIATMEAQTMKQDGATKSEKMKIGLRVNDKISTATMIDSKTTRDFVALLPLTVTMNDLFGREKYGHLLKAISTEGERAYKYDVGDIAYWSPGPDVAIFYRQDGERIPPPGIIIIGRVDSGVESFNVAGPVKVTMELLK